MVRGNWGIGAISSNRQAAIVLDRAGFRGGRTVRCGTDTMDCRLGAKESVRGWSLAWAGVAAKRGAAGQGREGTMELPDEAEGAA